MAITPITYEMYAWTKDNDKILIDKCTGYKNYKKMQTRAGRILEGIDCTEIDGVCLSEMDIVQVFICRVQTEEVRR